MSPLKIAKYALVEIARTLNWLGSGISIRLVQWTGKSTHAIHPKHLLPDIPLYQDLLPPSSKVLDIGCHKGERALRIAPFVSEVIAFDYDHEALAQAKTLQEETGIKNVTFLYASAEEPFPFANGQFDVILFLDVLEHINNRDHALRECWRVLVDGGTMALAIPNVDTAWKRFQKSAGAFYYSDPDHKIEYSRDEIERAVQDADFRVISIEPITYDIPVPGLFDFIGGLNLRIYKRLSDWRKRKARKNPANSIGFMVICRK